MRIAYLTVDEVNCDLARRWAAQFQYELVALSPCHPLPNGEYDAAIYDLDCLDASVVQQVLTMLLTRSRHSPAVVHSYNLRPRQASDLLARGVLIRHRLERGILALLRREVRRLRADRRQAHVHSIAVSGPEKHPTGNHSNPLPSLGF